MISVTKNNFLYEEIKQYIIDNIKDGTFPIGKKLPSEQEIIEQFSTSHMTVNKALVALADAGYIKRIKKKGSYVICQNIGRNMNEMISLTEQYKRGGIKISNILIDYRKVDVTECLDEYLKDLMGLSDNDFVHYFCRVRFADNKAIQVQKDLVSSKVVPYIDKDCLCNSFYAFLKDRFDIVPVSGDTTLKVVKASGDIVDYLHLKQDDPVIKLNHITKVENGDVLEYNTTYSVIDNFKMHISTHV